MSAVERLVVKASREYIPTIRIALFAISQYSVGSHSPTGVCGKIFEIMNPIATMSKEKVSARSAS